VLVVLLAAAAVILGGVIVVAIGRGGELAHFGPDVPPQDTEIMTGADVALLRLPASLWGYDMRATDEALHLVARAVTERDVEIATLRRQLTDVQSALARAHAGQVVHPRDPAGAPGPGVSPASRREAGDQVHSPADPRPWSAWERRRPAPLPDQDEPSGDSA